MKRILKSCLSLALCGASITTFAQSLHFDGIDDIVSSSYAGVTSTNARTLEAWVKTSAIYDPNSGGVQGVIMDYGSMSNTQRFTVNILWNNAPRVEIGGSGVSSTTAINDGNWHHIAVVYDPTNTTNNIAIYIDGTQDKLGNLPAINTGSGVGFRIGQRIDNSGLFEGNIDEVRVWNTALTSTEINASMNNELCTLPNNLELYWMLNDGNPNRSNSSVTTATDELGNHNGTLTGFTLNGSSSNWTGGKALVNGRSVTNLSLSSCTSVTLPSNGQVVTTSGNYADTLTSQAGCDSIFNYTVTIAPVDTAVTVSSETITATSTADSYQWIDCATGQAISGETASSYTATANGSYAVVITSGACTDTSACVEITGIGIEELGANSVKVYPNPSKDGSIHIDIFDTKIEAISIVDQRGVEVYNTEMEGTSTTLNVDLPSGSYILRCQGENAIYQERLIVL